jgi:hypothetical protein
MKDLMTGKETGLKESRQDFSQFREELNSKKQFDRMRVGRDKQSE